MSERPKNVLIVGMTDNPGGIEALMMNVMAAIDEREVHFDVLANTERVAFEDRLLSHGAQIHRITARRDSRLAFYRELDDLLDRTKGMYDAIWENMNTLGNIDYLIHARRFGIPVRIMHCHNSRNCDGLARGVLHWGNRPRVRRCATHFWSVSDEASAWFYGPDYAVLPNYRVVTNAIDAGRYTFNASVRKRVRDELGIEPASIVLGNVGRVQRVKNQRVIIEALAKLRENAIPCDALIVGGGDLEADIRAHAEHLGVADRLHITGCVDDTSPYYSVMDAFVFPSLHEGLSIALLEAQAAGLPVVASDRVLLDGVLTDEKRMLPLDAPPRAWADAILGLVYPARRRSNPILGSRFDAANLKGLFNDVF